MALDGETEMALDGETEATLDEAAILDEADRSDLLVTSAPSQNGDLAAAASSTSEPVDGLEDTIQSIEEVFESLPSVREIPIVTSQTTTLNGLSSDHQPQIEVTKQPVQPPENQSLIHKTPQQTPAKGAQGGKRSISNLSVRVDLDRLDRMNNQVGELAINRNSLALQNDQLQWSVQGLLNRFERFQDIISQLRKLSDQMIVSPDRYSYGNLSQPDQSAETRVEALSETRDLSFLKEADFDALEMDSYGTLHSLLQGIFEEVAQLEESVGDVTLFAEQSNHTLEAQRQMLTQVRDELMWARMLPLNEVLKRFPRVLRDLSAKHHKPVELKLSGTGVLVDRAILEKLYDPLLHLLRNAFDHGIEASEIRQKQGKPEQGQIEIRAYHKGNQTVIEVKDDGQGLNSTKIARRAIEMGLLTAEQAATISPTRACELIFEPGFSTASQVSDLSGRGVGLDVVRLQLRSLKGTVTVTSAPGQGTTFVLRLPLTLTIAKLLVCLVGSAALAFPSDSIEEIVIPKPDQLKQAGAKQFLHWREQVVPVNRLANLLDYACPLPEVSPGKALVAVTSPEDWASPLLVIRQGQDVFALEVDRLVTEQELVIKSFGAAIAPPTYTYGCTILGDGNLVPVVDGAALIRQTLNSSMVLDPDHLASNSQSLTSRASSPLAPHSSPIKTIQTPTVLIVDDSAAMRRTLALTLQKSNYRVLQAQDGQEATEKLKQSQAVQLVICDVEMPKMNGFEFLSYRRQDAEIRNIPVAMLTSRSNDKHRRLAMHLGATAYFTKPYIEQEFLSAIQALVNQKTEVKR
ncbi:MAG: hybrid sensor histidine kinase/response regulator [Cyanothece sp. SIO1E1]|nr:hybrid sensor histidine kinase/response regulator [Cyanothece sp. SIO1E1]